MTLSGARPFSLPSATLGFVELAELVASTGFSVATLDYVYRHATQPGQGPALSDSVVADTIEKVRAALGAVRQDTAVTDDPDGALLSARLSQLQSAEIVSTIVDALDPSKGLDAAARSQVLATYLGPTLGGAEQQVLAEADPDPGLPPAEYEVAVAARRAQNRVTILVLVSAWLRGSLSESAVISAVGASLALSDSTTRRLLVDWIPGDGSASALATLLQLAGGGLTAHFFAEPAFNGIETIRDDELVAAQLTSASATRSARWVGRVLSLGAGEHVFVLRTNGAVEITIGTTTATFAAGGSVVDHEVAVSLAGNVLVPIDVKYDAGTAAGQIELLWRLATSKTAAPLPGSALFAEAGLAVLDGTQGPGFAWRLAHKASLLIGALGLSEDEIDYAQSSDAPFGAFQLRDLPMSTPSEAELHAHFERWEQLARFAAQRAALPGADVTLIDVLTTRDPDARIAEWAQRMCDATGWDVETVTALLDDSTVDANEWATLSPTQIFTRLVHRVAGDDLGERIARLRTCIGLIKRVGAAAETLRGWCDHDPTATEADEVVQAVRARYTDGAEWLQVAQARNDTLRQQQRDALVAYVMPRMLIDGKPPVDVNALFEHFLIDIEMCACGVTSRVKQAISSVQTFVQRILLGLEDGITPDSIDPDRWKWNSIYRVWQANREIFLYPENWIDPELRVDKTPFFADLQSQLSQGPLDESNVEAAFRAYLEKLLEVSRLKICAIHWQREGADHASPIAPDDEIDVLHVVARTLGAHPTYFYRTLIGAAKGNGGTEWTPWRKIDLDIQGDGDQGDTHIVLATFNRRLYMFWSELVEQPRATQPGAKEGESPPTPLTKWEIRLAWSTYRNGAWSPKQLSGDSITSKRFIDKDDKDLYADEVAEFEANANQVSGKLFIEKLVLVGLELEFWQHVQQLLESFKPIADVIDDMLFFGDPYEEYAAKFGGSLAELDEYCSSKQTSVEDLLEDLFDYVDDVKDSILLQIDDDMSLSPSLKSLTDEFALIRSQRDVVAKTQAKYDELMKEVESFEEGKTNLAIPDQTERADHTFWLATPNNSVRIHVLRHLKDDTLAPRQLGYFTLSDDGRSITATTEAGTADISELVPADIEPRTNGFKIVNGSGLDLNDMPNLLHGGEGVTFYGEHWYEQEITADSPRPFFVAKGGDVHVALPKSEQVMMSAPMAFWVGAFEKADGGAATKRLTERSSKSAFGTIQVEPSHATLVVKPKPYVFEPFHHPFAKDVMRRLERDGVDGALTIQAQNPAGDDHGEKNAHFDEKFDPASKFVAQPYSPHDVDFRPQGAYAQYNWELFFHAPYLIASRLMQDGRYDEAQRWLHYIFDPTTATTGSSPDRFWNLQWFRDHHANTSADQIMTALCTNEPPNVVAKIRAQIDQWVRYPADPHRIASLRTTAYQKAIFFKYIDNLIAWADSLFTQNTIETINQATQLYIFASHLLGPRPQHVPQKAKVDPVCYAQLRGGLSEMSDMLSLVESTLHKNLTVGATAVKSDVHALLGITHLPVTFADARPLVFCVPSNSKLLGYFDTIDDRLFKIRHCMNIEGVVQQLPLFEPPIDPAMLVRAAAMGLDIGSILADLSAPLPFHRFATILQKANDVCSEVKSLGAQLLSALEKKDGEALSLLRAQHESALHSAIRDVKKQQVEDAKKTKEAIERTREVSQAKLDYYASREFINDEEIVAAALMATGAGIQFLGGQTIAAASVASMFPDFEIGPTGMGAHATASAGGRMISTSIRAFGESLNSQAQLLKDGGSMAATLGSYRRRQEEWDLQKDLAKKELAQIDKQIAAADIKIEIATLELSNQQLQIDSAKKVEETLRTKYTNTELYQWMVTQLSTVYYQAYKLAYDLAKRAERCYRYELGISSSSFINFGYWDSMRKGLLAGEELALDLKRLEAAHLQGNRRDFEITRQVSLVMHDPSAFVKLRETGSCEVTLPETFFDSDYPGHYFRRIKSMSLTLPCVAGPYTPINCTLTLLRSAVRISSTASSNSTSYPEHDAPNDPRFSHSYGAIQSVATSHGQNDSGMFDVSFRDDRYLPFEGAGAISTWRIELSKDTNAFDFDTLSDVVLKLSYTARDGGAPLATSARKWRDFQRKTATLEDGITPGTPLQRLFRVRYEFSDDWIAFRNALSTGEATLELRLDRERFPFQFRGAGLTIVGVRLLATGNGAVAPFMLRVAPPAGTSVDITLEPTADPSLLKGNAAAVDAVDVKSGDEAVWKLTGTESSIASLRDLLFLVTYVADFGN
jgi:hypothetical protein